MRLWEASQWGGPPMTSARDGSVIIDGPDRDLDLEFQIESYGERVTAFIPVAVLANHMRLAGWTVVPPEVERSGKDGGK